MMLRAMLLLINLSPTPCLGQPHSAYCLASRASIQGLPGLHLTLQNRPNNVCNAKEPYLPCFFSIGPIFSCRSLHKIATARKEIKTASQPGSQPLGAALPFPPLNCSTSFEATEIA